ncbi:pseudouridine synthase, partial [Acinetobacter baumannii]|nr:pseudouridine synthase [Acinetobacter baumannii]
AKVTHRLDMATSGLLMFAKHRDAEVAVSKMFQARTVKTDTAHLHFDQVRVPASNLLGKENAGFKVIMNNFNMERF